MSAVGHAVGMTLGTMLGSGSGIFVYVGRMLGGSVGIDVNILVGRLLGGAAGIELWGGLGEDVSTSDGADVGLGELATNGWGLGNTEGTGVAMLCGNDGPDVGLTELVTKGWELGNTEGTDVVVLWGMIVGCTCGSAAGVDVEQGLGWGVGIEV